MVDFMCLHLHGGNCDKTLKRCPHITMNHCGMFELDKEYEARIKIRDLTG